MSNQDACCGSEVKTLIVARISNRATIALERKRRHLRTLLIILLFCTAAGLASGQTVQELKKPDTPFPTYGKGPIEVRLYTDYFCAPCRTVEPDLEPVIEDLVKRNVITLTFVDTPVYKYSSLYARYFLYAVKEKNDFARAVQVKHVLFDGASRKITEKEQLEAFLKEKGVSYVAFDTTPVFAKLNALLKNDKVMSTPTCVIVKDGKNQVVTGGPGILSAVRALK
jgi:thiol-disulfide isomerase/thioredoxin